MKSLSPRATALTLFGLSCLGAQPLSAQATPAAVIADPPVDKELPPGLAMFTVPSHGVDLDAWLYVASGPGPHGTVILPHGLPGYEMSGDLAQSIRRAGWNVLLFHYRGTWGVPGPFSQSSAIEDTAEIVRFLREPANVAKYRADPRRLVLIGHSFGGFIAGYEASHDADIKAVAMIAAVNLGKINADPKEREARLKRWETQLHPVHGATAAELFAEAERHAKDWDYVQWAEALRTRPVLLVEADDQNHADMEALASALRQKGAVGLEQVGVATDHSFSDHRIALQAIVLRWLEKLETSAGAQVKSDDNETQAEILWDTWGVPHIFAKDTNSAARALGWAQMQNHGNRLLRAIAIARGRGAEYFGQELLDSDEFTRTMGTYAISQRWRAQQNPESASYLEAFVAGINNYARQYPEQLTAQARAVLPVESVDVIAAGTRLLTRFVATAGRCTSVFVGHSNGWAIGPSRSASGHAMALENEQVPWDLEWATFFEVQMVSPEFDLYGGTIVGLPVFASMFSPYVGWSLPVNTIDACDLYELTPDADGYRFDGAKRTFSIQKEIIKVRNQDGTFREVPWEIRRAVQGPVVQNGSKLFAIRLAGLEVSSMAGALEQLSAMARARNLIEFQAAMQRMQVPMWNVIYADRDGHIFELYNGHVPVRPNYDMQFWSKPVPGDTSALVWNQIHPYGDLPNVVDPPSGWVQSSNGPPWFMTFPFGDPKNYAPYAAPPAWMTGGLVGTSPQALLSPREQSGLRMLMQGGKISLEKLVEDKYSTRSQMADRVLDDLINVANQSDSDTTKLAAKTLQAWDRKADAQSRGAALFEFWAEEMRRRGFPGFYAEPFDLHRPLETPRGLSEPKAAAEALDVAAQKLIKAAGRLDVPWGDLYRLRRGKIDLPASGAGDLLGSFRVLQYEATRDGRFTAIGVDNFIVAVEFSTPIRAKVLLTSGNSSDPNSPHYGDQLVLSAKKQLRDAWLSRAEIEKHMESRTVFGRDRKVISQPATESN